MKSTLKNYKSALGDLSGTSTNFSSFCICFLVKLAARVIKMVILSCVISYVHSGTSSLSKSNIVFDFPELLVLAGDICWFIGTLFVCSFRLVFLRLLSFLSVSALFFESNSLKISASISLNCISYFFTFICSKNPVNLFLKS